MSFRISALSHYITDFYAIGLEFRCVAQFWGDDSLARGDLWQGRLGFSACFEEGVGQAQGLPLRGRKAWMGRRPASACGARWAGTRPAPTGTVREWGPCRAYVDGDGGARTWAGTRPAPTGTVSVRWGGRGVWTVGVGRRKAWPYGDLKGLEGLGWVNLVRLGTCYECRHEVGEGCCRRGGVAGAEPPHKGGPNRPDRTTAVVSG